ncbi:phosphoethanolamine--lipid A transferase [Marinobacterium maritimum]|uniref:Phosphoethanolamine--lipid A transferase n=1 Tax=Marinobacterium maritimum TaxID=500162 RepID=A0ABP3TEE0_9GAMM
MVLSAVVTLLLCLFYNGPLWRLIGEQPYPSTLDRWLFTAAFFSFVAAIMQLFLGALAWPRLVKPIAIFLLISAASVNYFMESYGILIDKTMVQNLFETDTAEATDLLSIQLLLHMLIKGIVPAVIVLLIPLKRTTLKPQLTAQSLSLFCCITLIGLNAAVLYKDFSSLFRNHREIRNLVVPSNYLYYTSRYLAGAYDPVDHTFQALGTDAVQKRLVSAGNHKPDLLVVVLGETARSMNFSLNGYARDTNPELAKQPVVSFRQVESCGTSTAVSVPCMFSLMARDSYNEDQANYQSNVLDVLQQAGISVLWRDNNSGCKGVCERVPHEDAGQFNPDRDCRDEECFDEQMLTGLEQWLAQQTGSAVIVLHQKGSHGPAYYKRVPESYAHFTPVCDSNQLQSCSQETITNAYDNSIRYTDHLLSRVIDFLQQQNGLFNTVMLYVSDHGESLGENNIYLHGMPRMIAPDEQKKVPLITWLSDDFQLSHRLPTSCLQSRKNTPLSHDNLTHSLLGLMNVSTQVYAPELDLFAPCQGSSATLAQHAGSSPTTTDG